MMLPTTKANANVNAIPLFLFIHCDTSNCLSHLATACEVSIVQRLVELFSEKNISSLS